jgi:hypothetical protein
MDAILPGAVLHPDEIPQAGEEYAAGGAVQLAPPAPESLFQFRYEPEIGLKREGRLSRLVEEGESIAEVFEGGFYTLGQAA